MTRRSFHRRRRVLGTSLTRLLISRAPRTVSRAFSGRSALLTIGKQLRINMNSYSSGRRPRRSRGGGRRRGNQERFRGPQEPAKTQKKTFWQRVAEFFGNGGDKKKVAVQPRNGAQPSRPARKPERVEVTSPRLYVGNLSFDATESDLFELFDAHLFQEPAALDFLRGHYLKAFHQLRIPVVSLHAHQCAARLVYPQQHV